MRVPPCRAVGSVVRPMSAQLRRRVFPLQPSIDLAVPVSFDPVRSGDWSPATSPTLIRAKFVVNASHTCLEKMPNLGHGGNGANLTNVMTSTRRERRRDYLGGNL